MSQFPPPPSDPAGFDNTLPYGGAPKTSGMALTAMILGIIAIPTACIGVGFLLGIVAVVLGIVALVNISKDPVRFGGKGMAIAGIATGGGGAILMIPLMIAILLPSLGKSRELAQRSTCAANLRGIMQSMLVYANDNSDYYPYGAATVSAGPGCGNPGAPNSVMYGMFMVVGSGMVAPKQFICKSDPAGVNPSVSPSQGGAFPGYSPTYWNLPGKDPNLTYSYSFAFQFSEPNKLGNWWRNTVDAGLPIGADMNPGDQNSKAMKNSLNHNGDGQNVGFADGHAEFSRIPTCGENNDHIYNTNSINPNTPGTIGQPPFVAPANNSMGMFDTCLIPGLADKTNYTRK